ncbi:MAG: type secretion system protein GspE, partial [Pseudomonadota bacterium]
MSAPMQDPRLLPFAFARDFGVLAQAGAPEQAIDVWISDTTPVAAVAEISRRYGRLRLNRLTTEQLERAIAQAYASGSGDAAQVVGEVESDLDLARLMQEMPAVEDLLEAADDAPVIRMINALLTQALREGASDIHIEPFEQISIV